MGVVAMEPARDTSRNRFSTGTRWMPVRLAEYRAGNASAGAAGQREYLDAHGLLTEGEKAALTADDARWESIGKR